MSSNLTVSSKDMIICICRNVSDKDIRRCLYRDCSCSTIEDLQFELGVCLQCESCKESIEQILKEEK